jgi:hypothetical protein
MRALSKLDPISTVIEKYISSGWSVFRSPKGGINDLIAQKDNKFHFIQVIHTGDVREQDIPKNTFVQNAFSNQATPVHARIFTRGNKTKISLEDVNLNKRIIVAKRERVERPNRK